MTDENKKETANEPAGEGRVGMTNEGAFYIRCDNPHPMVWCAATASRSKVTCGFKITPCDNGFIVKAGCKKIVFADKNEMLACFARWADDPVAEFYRWENNLVTKKEEPINNKASEEPTP